MGHMNKDNVIKGDYSYDGRFVISGSEDSQV
jgi:hypothetical protein